MTLEIADESVASAGLTAAELKRELATKLFGQGVCAGAAVIADSVRGGGRWRWRRWIAFRFNSF